MAVVPGITPLLPHHHGLLMVLPLPMLLLLFFCYCALSVATYDMQNWFRVQDTSYDETAGVLTIRHAVPPGVGMVRYAYFAHYSLERHAQLLMCMQVCAGICSRMRCLNGGRQGGCVEPSAHRAAHAVWYHMSAYRMASACTHRLACIRFCAEGSDQPKAGSCW